jgi:hypothetical protein
MIMRLWLAAGAAYPLAVRPTARCEAVLLSRTRTKQAWKGKNAIRLLRHRSRHLLLVVSQLLEVDAPIELPPRLLHMRELSFGFDTLRLVWVGEHLR